MDDLNIVIVEPIYQINLGYMARVLKNFGIERMNLVNPRCRYRGKEAIKYSKHARGLLEGAKVFGSIEEATKGSFVVGTTAIWRKTGVAFYNVYTLERLLGMVKKNKRRRVSVLIGRDNIGLTKEELAKCDATIFIPTSDEYPALNISHALAIILYAFTNAFQKRQMESYSASAKEEQRVKALFSRMISKRMDIRDKRAVAMAFDHIIGRANPTKKEIGALSIALSPRRKG
ncbi:MAG TPA: RNA methyltransferase [Candidatus Acidoferrum sp.]|nr:RNA methyltransferase [Candidatus Acidoferrum sp.]